MLKNQTPPANSQDAFNRVWQHFIVEKNPKAVTKNATGLIQCVYRTENGNGCAAGIMMPDQMAKDCDAFQTVGKNIAFWMIENDDVRKWFQNVSEPMKSLQIIHDRSEGTENMELALRQFAIAHQLTIPA